MERGLASGRGCRQEKEGFKRQEIQQGVVERLIWGPGKFVENLDQDSGKRSAGGWWNMPRRSSAALVTIVDQSAKPRWTVATAERQIAQEPHPFSHPLTRETVMSQNNSVSKETF